MRKEEMIRIPGTEIEVSRICFGTMNFGNPVSEKDAAYLLHYAAERGINFIDTANMYEGYDRVAGSSGGTSEKYIGSATAGRRSDYVIATKVGMCVGEAPEDNYTSPAAIRKYTERSLAYLKTDYIDVMYAHRFDPVTPPAEVAGEMTRQIELGNFRCWGVSNYTAEQLTALIAACDENGLVRPSLCQPPLSLLKQDALSDILPLCEREGIGCVPYQVLQGGLLTGKYKRGMPLPEGSRKSENDGWVWELDSELFDRLEAIEADADALRQSMTAYAIGWALLCPSVLSALVGIKRAAQIDAAIEALR